VPEIAGGAVLAGGEEPGSAATAAVAVLVAAVGPVSFDAVTVTRIVFPTSPEPRRYCADVAPAREAQLAPAASQRFHWYAYDVGELVQVPFEAASCWPCCAAPEIVGGAVFTGAGGGGGGCGDPPFSTSPLVGPSVTEVTAVPSARVYVPPSENVWLALGLGFRSTVPPE